MKMIDIPPGYRADAKGNLVPESNIKPIDLIRDELIHSLIEQGMEVANKVQAFRQRALREIQSFVELSAMEYDIHLGGSKGNIMLTSFDGKFRIKRAMDENLTFDEKLEAAKALIDECLRDWTVGSNANLKVLINKAFEANGNGQLSTARVLGLRTLKIDDKRWLQAMAAIGDSVQVIGTKTYIRMYERVGDSDEYRQISLTGSPV